MVASPIARCERRVDAHALEAGTVAIAVGILVHARDTHGETVVHAIPDIEGRAPVVPGTALQRYLAHRLPVGLARYAVHDAARPTAAKDHRVRTLQDLDPVEVVKVPVILDVVAYAVQEKVRGRAVAAQDDRVAITLALRHAGTGHVARDIRQALHRLVLDQVACDHGHRLRHVDERRIGLHGRAALLGQVAIGLVFSSDHHLGQRSRRDRGGIVRLHGLGRGREGHCKGDLELKSARHVRCPHLNTNENDSY